MASATVLDSPSDHRHLRLDSLPLIDLRLLSQTELYSLSLCSSSSHPHRRFDDDVLIPKVDRSVFNESAGSRKQTYSRLRLAPRNSQFSKKSSSSSAVAASIALQNPEPLDHESFQIIGLLKQLFSPEAHGGLVPVSVDYNDSLPESSNNLVHNIPIDIVVDSALKKRKRGRPRKNPIPEIQNKGENDREGGHGTLFQLGNPLPISSNAALYNPTTGIASVPVSSSAAAFRNSTGDIVSAPVSSNEAFQNSAVDNVGGGGSQVKRKRGRPRKNDNRSVESTRREDKAVATCAARGRAKKKEELVNVDRNGNVVDLVALGNLEDPFGEELRKRTQGLETEAELLGFLGGLEGEWASWRKKKKIVAASEFGDVLPNGWKIMLSLKRREGRVWLFCRRYVSPNGQQFVSCKEVSSYLLACFGLQDASQSKPGLADGNIQLANEDASLTFEDVKRADELVSNSRVTVSIASMSTDHGKQDIPLDSQNTIEVQMGKVLKCQHHTMTFDEKNDLVHHLLSYHDTANRCSSLICEGVVLKDGKYECQFCNKIFDEKILYNGHVVVNAKDYVESRTVSKGISLQKNSDPSRIGISSISLQLQELIGVIDEKKHSTSVANDELSYGVLHSKLEADNVTETCIDRDGLSSCAHEEQVINGSKDEKNWEFCEKQAVVCHMTKGKLGKLDEAINFAETATSKNENENIFACSDGTDVVKCISISSVGEPKLDVEIETHLLSSSGKEKICSTDDIDDQQFTGRAGDGNDKSISPGHCGPGIEEESGLAKDANGFLTSIMMDSVPLKGSELSFCSSYIDEKAHVVSSDVNDSSSTFYESKYCEVDTSEKKEKIFGSDSNHGASNTDVVTVDDHGRSSGSFSRVRPLNEQSLIDVINAENPNFKMEESWQEKSFQGNVFTPFVVDNNVNESSIGTVNRTKVDDVRNYKGSEFGDAFNGKDTGINADIISSMEQEGDFGGGSFVLSSYERKYSLKDSVGYNRKTEEVEQDRDSSQSYLLSCNDYAESYDVINDANNLSSSLSEDSKSKEVKSFWNNEALHAFGSTDLGMDTIAGTSTMKGRSAEVFSLDISGNDQTFPITDVSGSGIMEEVKLKGGSEISLICPSGSQQLHSVRDNLKRVCSSELWLQPASEDSTTSRNIELMTDLEKSSQTCEDGMPELIWRADGENFQLSRFTDTSSAPTQLSGCFPNFNILSDKDAYVDLSVDERFESISGLEGLGSGSTEQLQYNSLTAQGTSNLNESKGLSHAEMKCGFDSSFWFENDELTLFPKTASRPQSVTICVCCRKEFFHQGISSGTKAGSVGLMCATCQAKLSG